MLCGCERREDKLIMATEAGFAPYEYYSDGKIVGVDVDIAREIAKELGKKLVVKDVAFDSIITEVKSGKSDIGAAGISYTEERAKSVDFSINYTESKQVVVVRKNGSIQDIDDIEGRKIAGQLGSIADMFVSDEYVNSTIVRQKKYLAAIQDLKDSKVDCVVMDELPAKAILLENNNLKILNDVVSEDAYGIIVDKGNKELLDVINRVIKRLKDDGKIDDFIIHHSKNS
jgi:polar amino acid transport system substrate-binding protein